MKKHKFIEDTKRNIITIFLIDDDNVDRHAVRRSFHNANVLNPILEATEGEKALELIKKYKMQQPNSQCLILLDLNMPAMNGIEFLTEQKKDDLLKTIPVIILTTSDSEEDKKTTSELGAIGFVTKNSADENLFQIIKSMPEKFHLNEL